MKRKKLINKLIRNDDGFTLVELLVSIVILAIIVGAFASMFVFATKANVTTHQIVDTGYIAQTCMEEVYTVSTDNDMTGIIEELKSQEMGYIYNGSGDNHEFTKEIEGYFVKIGIAQNKFTDTSGDLFDDLIKVTVGVYKDDGYSELSASVQNIISLN